MVNYPDWAGWPNKAIYVKGIWISDSRRGHLSFDTSNYPLVVT